MTLALFGDQKRVSPHEKVAAVLGDKTITIEYGRPHLKGRAFWDVVPAGDVWRTGDDDATTLTTDVDLTIGQLKVPAGKYSVFTVPTDGDWTLVLNKVVKQWGAYTYRQDLDLGRTKMTVKGALQPVDQFTITVEKSESDPKKGTLKIAWGRMEACVPVSVQ